MILNIKTSNYARAGKLPGAVSISVTAPWWFRGPTYPALVPPPKLVRAHKDGEITNVEYVTRYDVERLSLLDPGRVVEDLLELAAPHVPVLLCWCAAAAFCHRILIRNWFQAAGVECEEVEPGR